MSNKRKPWEARRILKFKQTDEVTWQAPTKDRGEGRIYLIRKDKQGFTPIIRWPGGKEECIGCPRIKLDDAIKFCRENWGKYFRLYFSRC